MVELRSKKLASGFIPKLDMCNNDVVIIILSGLARSAVLILTYITAN
jgi:hypothetical protein